MTRTVRGGQLPDTASLPLAPSPLVWPLMGAAAVASGLVAVGLSKRRRRRMR